MPVRGMFIVFEGIDRCGKTTQAELLVDRMRADGIDVEYTSFPCRSSSIGNLITSFLRGELELDDRAAHLLFSADRYNVIALIEQKLKAGITVVLDRYLYSGIAYSAARGLSIDWCISVDDGLPTPDLVFFLDVSVMRDRDGGSERYEETLFQLAVYRSFTSLFNRSCLREVVCTVADQSVASTHVFIYTRCSDEYDRMKGFGVFQI